MLPKQKHRHIVDACILVKTQHDYEYHGDQVLVGRAKERKLERKKTRIRNSLRRRKRKRRRLRTNKKEN